MSSEPTEAYGKCTKQGADQMTISASERITEAVTSWAGVTAGTGRRGEWSFKVGPREIGHLHGDHAAHFSFPKQVWTELMEQGRITYHPVFPGRVGPAARNIENDADVRDVIELMRLNYDRLVAGTTVAERAA
jgi:Luciferase